MRVVELLMAGYRFPDSVELVDAGTMGFTILDLIRDREFVLVIDAMDGTGHPPGTVSVLSADDIAPNTVLHSLHDMRLVDVLQAAELLERRPETICVGVQVESMAQWVLELTPPVEAALPIAAAAALEILRERGIEPTPREDSDFDAAIIEALRTYDPMPDGNEPSSA